MLQDTAAADSTVTFVGDHHRAVSDGSELRTRGAAAGRVENNRR